MLIKNGTKLRLRYLQVSGVRHSWDTRFGRDRRCPWKCRYIACDIHWASTKNRLPFSGTERCKGTIDECRIILLCYGGSCVIMLVDSNGDGGLYDSSDSDGRPASNNMSADFASLNLGTARYNHSLKYSRTERICVTTCRALRGGGTCY